MANNFLDDLRAELIEDKPEFKILFDYIDGRVKEEVEQHMVDGEYATQDYVESAIQTFNDR